MLLVRDVIWCEVKNVEDITCHITAASLLVENELNPQTRATSFVPIEVNRVN